MKRTQFDDVPCSIARSLGILGDWWSPLLIREALYGKRKFSEFEASLSIKKNMLTTRLNLLVEYGVFEKVAYQERPQRYEYLLTELGYDAAKAMLAMMPFGNAHFFPDGKPPIELYDKESGEKVEVEVVDRRTGKPLDARRLMAGPGPSFPRDRNARRTRFPEYFGRFVDPDEPDS